MKEILKFSAFILYSGVVIFVSCKKETSCEGCACKNKPPIAKAGLDQVITLPSDSVLLDGNSSSDPNGKINEWLWTKISGPVSFNIIKTSDSITKVKSLAVGTYQFELKVTDNCGLFAKDTVRIIVDSRFTNHPPVANAGVDQTITLPNNTVNLDGSGSTDPDNNISSYLWTKISGPLSFTITNSNVAQTQVTNLTQGTYQFELKVADNGGLFSKDTANIIVNSSVPTSSISVLGCNAAMIPFENLPSAGGVVHTAAAGDKILFVRYTNNGVVDIYDTTTHGWSTVSNMFSTYGHNYNNNSVTLGNKIIYSEPNWISGTQYNGQLINIYDASTNTWTINTVSEGRDGYTKAIVGNKVFYAGGATNDSPFVSKKIDIYDAVSNAWAVINFPEARIGMSAASIGNKIFFAGGYITRYDSLVLGYDDFGNSFYAPAVVAIDKVDIFDVVSNTWSVAHLSEPRWNIATAVVGNRIVFASGNNQGGYTSSVADIYNAATNTWTNANLSGMGNGVIGAYSVGNKVLINYLVSDKVDIYNATNNSWSLAQMPQPLLPSAQERTKAVVIGNKILFYTIFTSESDSKNVDMYDAVTNQWCHALLNKRHIRAGVISYGNRVYIAGGSTDTNCCTYDTSLNTVWFFNF